jgi:hypothetical protein
VMRRPVRFASLLLSLLVMPVGGATAAETDCLGRWHFEISRPDPEKETWLSPESWCRAKNLPRTLDVEVQRETDGRVTIAGAPLQPTDVLAGGGQCNFQLSESPNGPPKNYELALEVPATGAVVRGSARCSERKAGSDGARGGISISVTVAGTHSSSVGTRPVPAADARGVAAPVLRACLQQDGDALWKLLTARFRAELDDRATQILASVPAADLRRLYGHHGQPNTFKGLALLRHAVKADQAPDNPCSDVAHWRIGEDAASPDGRLVTVLRPDGFTFALKFVRANRAWQLDQISKSLPPPKR